MIVPQVMDAKFISGSDSLEKLPNYPIPEIAVIGRSNVGKSSFINRLTGRKNLARTSATPGRTQQINLFKIQGSLFGKKNQGTILADLPGFGYAKLSFKEREKLNKLIADYILFREETFCFAMLNDSRREPGEEELIIRNLIAEQGKHLIVVLTKCDKLSRSEQNQRSKIISQSYGLESQDIILAGENLSTTPFWEKIGMLLSALQDEASEPSSL